MVALLSRADLALGRLDGIARNVPEPDLFVAMYVNREAVLSSQIEGIQSTLEDLLARELAPDTTGVPDDVGEVVNYVAAMNHGLERLGELPLSLRLIREIHATLLRGGGGSRATPGEFRRTQNWIGARGVPMARATFVPPPPHELQQALSDLERFLRARGDLPALVHAGLAHAQFETVHPFLDGNGRVGRLLITFLLVHEGALHRPLLYLSSFLRRNRSEYYERLSAIRTRGDWEGCCASSSRGWPRRPPRPARPRSASSTCASATGNWCWSAASGETGSRSSPCCFGDRSSTSSWWPISSTSPTRPPTCSPAGSSSSGYCGR